MDEEAYIDFTSPHTGAIFSFMKVNVLAVPKMVVRSCLVEAAMPDEVVDHDGNSGQDHPEKRIYRADLTKDVAADSGVIPYPETEPYIQHTTTQKLDQGDNEPSTYHLGEDTPSLWQQTLIEQPYDNQGNTADDSHGPMRVSTPQNLDTVIGQRADYEDHEVFHDLEHHESTGTGEVMLLHSPTPVKTEFGLGVVILQNQNGVLLSY